MILCAERSVKGVKTASKLKQVVFWLVFWWYLKPVNILSCGCFNSLEVPFTLIHHKTPKHRSPSVFSAEEVDETPERGARFRWQRFVSLVSLTGVCSVLLVNAFQLRTSVGNDPMLGPTPGPCGRFRWTSPGATSEEVWFEDGQASESVLLRILARDQNLHIDRLLKE